MEPDPAASSDERLDSWKEIAVYLGRGVRTVQRWERHEGLPVRRHQHDKRGSVFALRPEIDRWRESRQEGGPTSKPGNGGGTRPRIRRYGPAAFLALLTAAAIGYFAACPDSPKDAHSVRPPPFRSRPAGSLSSGVAPVSGC